MIMKKINISVALVFLVFVGCLFTVKSTSVYGAQAAVQTNGEIVFTTESSQTSSTTSGSSEESIKKPVGKFPSTGELVVRSLSVSGFVLVLIVFAFYLLKRRSATDGKDGQSQ
ncbi:LPXTG-domain-containing protein cell wall anchor domain [Enterococcus haemoperoxidus ATCC BAA-382]|uniref:LPXTG-domain-containing protein cell wall anchor domain n=2 Tax=Enterococcus haemoperoxidus TaxID=155618 RepID=R2Q7G9_9ENTE|nr:LPXTG-domain-containing protein cell wall anchor domain [Enterococcus haemoperoxidus ATCC BAA-382]EOT61808.1 hypothetical protein I583_00790 [Enterococcus haemoperoxidus ATCC BAA-382]OJG53920.1 LPXTG-domain-containing protein cell wall anchor domain [Enterococcus haemoperoxidus]